MCVSETVEDKLSSDDSSDSPVSDIEKSSILSKKSVSVKDYKTYPVPFKNIRNQCYMISVIQMLLRISSFWENLLLVMESGEKRYEEVREKYPTFFSLILHGENAKDQYLKTFKKRGKSTLRAQSFEVFDMTRRKVFDAKRFSPDGQEDAMDFLVYLFE